MTYLVKVPLQPLAWPSLCACCLKPLPDATALCATSINEVLREPLAGVRYCPDCNMHHKRQAGLDAMFYGCLAGLGLGLVIGKLWLVVFAGLLYYVWLKDLELTRHANLHCAASRQAVRYRGQKHLQLIFEIDNRAYLEALMATNPRDLGIEVVSVKD